MASDKPGNHDVSAEILQVQSVDLPAPKGHYAPGISHGGVLYVSGQLGRVADMSDDEAGDIVVQTRRALASLAAVLHAGGADLSTLLKVNIYVSDVAHWPAVNAEYARILGAHRPARSIVPTGALHFNALVEIDAIAAVL